MCQIKLPEWKYWNQSLQPYSFKSTGLLGAALCFVFVHKMWLKQQQPQMLASGSLNYGNVTRKSDCNMCQLVVSGFMIFFTTHYSSSINFYFEAGKLPFLRWALEFHFHELSTFYYWFILFDLLLFVVSLFASSIFRFVQADQNQKQQVEKAGWIGLDPKYILFFCYMAQRSFRKIKINLQIFVVFLL